jgi:hypothetical protein
MMKADPRPPMAKPRSPLLPMVLAAVLVAGGAGIYWWLNRTPAVAPVADAPIEPAATATPSTATIQHPIEQVVVPPSAEPVIALPPLGESDALLFEALAALLADDGWRSLLAGDFLIQRFVATVDNLPRRKLAPHLLPVRSVAGPLQTAGEGGAVVIGDANAARYDAYVRVLSAIDPEKLVALYVRLYPLFQQAYRETGQPEGYFNDRLVEVIDHLIAAPTPSGPVMLVRPKVFWEFADPGLEQASAGEKLMVRIGPAHAATVRARLTAIRALLVAAPPAG